MLSTFLSSLRLLLRKAQHRDIDLAATAAATALDNFLKALYLEGGRPGCFILCIKMLQSFYQSHVQCP